MSTGGSGSRAAVGPAGSGAAGSGAADIEPACSVVVPVGAFVAWTLFVWIGRIRNVSADADLSGADRWGPLVMSILFVVGAVLLAALLCRDHVAASAASSATLRNAVWAVAVYTTVIWVIRAGDIALRGNHDVPFVFVHVVLASVSIALGVWTSVACQHRLAHITSVRP